MRAARHDDADRAFQGFMTSRWDRLRRAAYLLTGNFHDAEDLAQAALVRVYVKWDRVSTSNEIDAYVWRILVHTNADRVRRRRIRELLGVGAPEQAGDDRTGQVDVRRSLLDALGRLPVRQRTVLVLCYFEDMSHAQVAEVLGTKASTVRGQVTRALARLRADGTLAVLAGRDPEEPPDESAAGAGPGTETGADADAAASEEHAAAVREDRLGGNFRTEANRSADAGGIPRGYTTNSVKAVGT
ncbi:SigE family RNA polymerase sigma factor [Streptodolium elevatio]